MIMKLAVAMTVPLTMTVALAAKRSNPQPAEPRQTTSPTPHLPRQPSYPDIAAGSTVPPRHPTGPP